MCSVECDVEKDPNVPKDNSDLFIEAKINIRKCKESQLRKNMESVMGMIDDNKRYIKDAQRRIEKCEAELKELQETDIDSMIIYGTEIRSGACCDNLSSGQYVGKYAERKIC